MAHHKIKSPTSHAKMLTKVPNYTIFLGPTGIDLAFCKSSVMSENVRGCEITQ